MKELRSHVGLVFQYPEHQLFEVDVFSDVCFGPKNLGLPKEEIEKRAKEALDMVGLDESFYKQSPFDLSGGQKRRVAIAGVLAMKPEVLILDEPTVGLDVVAREEVLAMIREYMTAHEQAGVLISSHIATDLESLCDDLYLIRDGKIIMHEDTDVLLSEYALLKVPAEKYETLDKQYILRSKKESYGYACLTDKKQYYRENEPDLVMENGSIDELILMMNGGRE